jgi:alcohol dehydrogenase class IV
MKNLKKKNSIKEIISFLQKKKYQNILIVTGVNSFNNFNYKNFFLNSIKKKKYYVFYNKSYLYNEYKNLIVLIKLVNKLNPDVILAIGGGTVIDIAKLANTLHNQKNIKKNIITGKINLNINSNKCDLVAVPTTAGSGAEVTRFAVIYVNRNKYSLEHDLIKPDFFYLIPELVLTLKMEIRASSGFDAFSQAIESMISIQSKNSILKFSIKALKIITRSYLDFVNNPNLVNGMQMLKAANFSGKAINISKTTAAHAISYPFTSLLEIKHGQAVAINFSKFILFNYLNLKRSKTNFSLNDRYKLIFKLTNTLNIYDLCSYIDQLIVKSGLMINQKKLKKEILKNYEQIISLTNKERLSNNPVVITKSDLKKILELNFNKPVY